MLDETELYINLKINQNLTKPDIGNIYVRFQLEEQIQRQELKDPGWRFETSNSMTIYFYKTTEMNDSSFVKIPSAIWDIQNDDKYCFIWSIQAHFHPIADSKIGHTTRDSHNRQILMN